MRKASLKPENTTYGSTDYEMTVKHSRKVMQLHENLNNSKIIKAKTMRVAYSEPTSKTAL